jgi:hypothetical protein
MHLIDALSIAYSILYIPNKIPVLHTAHSGTSQPLISMPTWKWPVPKGFVSPRGASVVIFHGDLTIIDLMGYVLGIPWE